MSDSVYEVTEHQLRMISFAASEMGVDFNVFIASGSVAVTVFLTLTTTTIPDPAILARWDGGLFAFAVVAIVSLIRWIVGRSTFKRTIDEIRKQELAEDAPRE